MNKYLKILSPLIFLLSLASVLIFKTIPASKLWNDYTVLYTPVDTDDNTVVSTIRNCGIKNEVSLSGQYLPVSLPANSVEISMFKLNRDRPEYNYFIKRNAYFFDKSNTYRLYYIPNEYKSNLNNCVSILNSKNIQAGVDSTSSYPWGILIVTLLIILTLAFFSKKSVLFLIASIPTVVYLFSNPFYSGALSCILLILSIFFISNLWKRKGSFSVLITNRNVLIMILLSLVSSFSTAFSTGIFFVITIISIFSILVTYDSIEEFFNQKKSFNPVYILSAKKVSVFAKKSNIVMPALIVSALVLIGLFFLTSSQSINSHFSKLMLPASSSNTSDELPQLEDYYQWIWNIKSYPYKSINNKDENSYIVEYPRYKNDNGFVNESKVIMAYNQNFKENTFEEIDTLAFDSIEKVLKSEGADFSAGYVSTGSYSTNLFSVIMMIICFFVLLFIYFYTIIKKEI